MIDRTAEQCRWLIGLRWLAIAGIATAVALSAWLDVVDSAPWLYALVAAMAVYNVAFWLAARRAEARPELAHRLLVAQLVLDLVALTVLLHCSGGIENPFAFFYIFLVLIASLTCSKREAYAFGVGASTLFGTVAFLERAGWLVHHPLRLPSGSGVYLVGVLLALGATVAGVVVFASSTVERLRASVEAERALHAKIDQQERLAIIGEVVAGVVHELSTPLNGVRNSFRAFRRDPEGFLKRADIMQLMEEALDRMASISRRLLTLARDPQINKQPVVVNEIVEWSLADLQHRMDAAAVSIECRLAPGLRPISADRVAVGEVITNVVSNALDAVEGGGRIMVETSNGPGIVEIRVIDTGSGIPLSMQARLFQPFHSTKPAGKGTGLGLVISKRLVDAHGGSIAVESRDGEGTTVTVRLPAGE